MGRNRGKWYYPVLTQLLWLVVSLFALGGQAAGIMNMHHDEYEGTVTDMADMKCFRSKPTMDDFDRSIKEIKNVNILGITKRW